MSSPDEHVGSATGGFNVDWKAIRPIRHSKREGFEELCCQLAEAELPAGTTFVRKGVPDAGVECYAVLGDGHEWGWQAKYFDTLDDAQWRELDKSVRTALEKHPGLARYHICIPRDLSDARIERRHSEKNRWDDRVRKWTGWARSRGMDVEFVYWGSFELLKRLSLPENCGRLRFWFDVRRFDQAWLDDRLEEAIRAAGPRYTPEIHVELPVAATFEAFGRTEQFFEKLKAHARPIRKELIGLGNMAVTRDLAPADERPRDSCPAGTNKLADQVTALVDAGHRILGSLGRLSPQPVGPLPFRQLVEEVDVALASADELQLTLRECEKAVDDREAKARTETASSAHHTNPYRDRRYRLRELERELQNVRAALADADAFAGSCLLVLTGRAGTGKTHLLCDIARTRLRSGRPTVLLMGQRFLSAEAPWRQALQQLDLMDGSVEEFISALEAAAQAAGSRALLLIDALNEGAGRRIWPAHLAAFLTPIRRSKWVSVALAVRTSYEQMLIPDEVGKDAVRIEHQGFANCEYDASRTFFDHYGIERPSAALLVPEFQNPLFLKVLCRGLTESGQRRLPGGLQGLSATFDLFLDAVNSRLANELDFNPRSALVRRAVEELAIRFVDADRLWVPLEEAAVAVNTLLPGRDFHRSLYHGLVSEGVLIEEQVRREDGTDQAVVLIAYQRLADHLIVRRLLGLHLDPAKPEAAFGEGGRLAYLTDPKRYVSPGLIEALCVQVPERAGKELVELAPCIEKRWEFAEAFRQSLIWRARNAFSDETFNVLTRMARGDRELDATLEVLLTLATVPEHPFNAAFLHARLRRETMPARDAWWSFYLHRSGGTRGAVDRLIDWACSLTTGDPTDDKTVDLAARTLTWMLTTSNRWVRDRATKGLVNLLTSRVPALISLVGQFANVDDLYVMERVYAVAYGCAMRSHDRDQIGRLGQTVYDRVFRQGPPVAHLLLRDYARGVIERALSLGCVLDVDATRIRPPHGSPWPHVPTEEEIEPFKPDWSRGAYDSGDVVWARNRIGNSVLCGDFAIYVLGPSLTKWLPLRLDEPAWQSADERLTALVAVFNEKEKAAWDAFAEMERVLEGVLPRFVGTTETEDQDEGPVNTVVPDPGNLPDGLEQARQDAFAKLTAALSSDHAAQIHDILATRNRLGARDMPTLDASMIKRYILWRVFDLGWTVRRFGYFDRVEVGHHWADMPRAGERVGKKYQWIAYHEIIALVCDHFQYYERLGRDTPCRTYDGPWQDHFRDIDPSCTLRTTPGGTSLDGHSPAWWCSAWYTDWVSPSDHMMWVERTADLPSVQDLLVATDPGDGSSWVNVNGYFCWREPTAPDQDPYETPWRELWYMTMGYLVRTQDAGAFVTWAEGVDFWGRWMPEPPEVHEMFLGEHVWSPASRYFQQPYYGHSGWTRPEHGCPVLLCIASLEYHRGASGLDRSVDAGYALRLPAADLVRSMGLQWSGHAANYVDAKGRLAAFDPTAREPGPNALLIRQNALLRSLDREGLSLVWTVLGEKRAVSGGLRPGTQYDALRISGAYVLCGDGLHGFLNVALDSETRGGGVPVPFKTLRIPR